MKVITGALKYFNENAIIRGKQLGCQGVHFNRPPLWGKDTWDAKSLEWLAEYCKNFDMPVTGIENIPVEWFTPIILGYPERDECIERYLGIIKAVGKAGIPMLGYGFGAGNVWRTSVHARGRGGSECWQYIQSEEKNGNALTYKNVIRGEHPTREQLWENYAYFLNAVLPTAEKYQVKLALHPSDPMLPKVNGIPRIMVSVEDFKRAYELSHHSPAWGINLCIGCFSQLGGRKAVLEMIRYFGPKGKLFQVHFRDVIGETDHFTECFLGEGNFNPAEIICELDKNGFDGCIFEDHVPAIRDDDFYHTIGRAHASGYIQGMLAMMKYMREKAE